METDYTHPQQTGKTDKPDYKVKTDRRHRKISSYSYF